jgi:hypothetical protein
MRGTRPWWLRWRGPILGPSLLSESSSVPEGLGDTEPPPGGSGEVSSTPKGSGDTEPVLEGSDWDATTLTIVPDRLRLMSFNSCLMGTLILVPDSSPLACGGVGHSSIGFTIGCQGLHSSGVHASAPTGCSPRVFREVGYFAKGFLVQGDLRVLVWLGGH